MKDILKRLRLENGLTQQQLADKLFVKQTTVSAWEKGRNIPDFKTQQQLSALYNVPLDVLAGMGSAQSSINVTADNNSVNNVNAPVTIQDTGCKFLTTQESDLIRIFRAATGKQQLQLMGLAYQIEDETQENNEG